MGLFSVSQKRVSRYLNFVVGYSINRRMKLSPGFQRAASQFIKDIDLKDYPDYERFKGFKSNGNRKTQKRLDGLPLVDPTDQEKLFTDHPPMIPSFNSGIYIGVVFPIDVK